MKRIFYLLLLPVLFLLPRSSSAQLVLTPSNDAMQLGQALLGPGVQITYAVLDCSSNSAGLLTASGIGLPVDSAVVLTTGSLLSIANDSKITMSDHTCQPCNDADLLSASTSQGGYGQMHDACKLDLNVIPSYDTLRFSYLFASEEYPEFVCSPFNDVFGFFVSGPGISGSYSYNSMNIAVIPGTQLPVSINTVNGGGTACDSNSLYFLDTIPNPYVVFDGYTTLMEASVVVQPGQTYKLRLKIGDATDQILDSGIIIKSGSLQSVGVAEVRSENDFNIYPNPAAEQVLISWPHTIPSALLQLYDPLGRLVLSKTVQNTSSETLDLTSQAPGLYFLEISVEDEKITKKLKID